MRAMFDFQCDNGHVNEKFVDTETTEVQCPDCELIARKIVTPIKVQGDKNSWKEVRNWSKQRESHIKHERKQGITL